MFWCCSLETSHPRLLPQSRVNIFWTTIQTIQTTIQIKYLNSTIYRFWSFFFLKGITVTTFNICWVFFKTCLQIKDFSSVQLLSHVWLFATPWTAAHQASLSITNFRSLPKLMSIESVMPSNHLTLCCPLLLLPLIFPSIRVFSNE